MNKKLLAWLTIFCALGLAVSAAYYSVIGLSKLFAGVALQVIIMASFLEASKLTLAAFLHKWWSKINLFTKTYYIIALITLSALTSMGIFGVLSSGYEETSNKMEIQDAKISLLETKKKNRENQRDIYLQDKESITEDISTIREALKDNKIQYVDKETGQLITTTSSSNRRMFQSQLDKATLKQTELDSRIDSINGLVFAFEEQIVEEKSNNTTANEIGPLKYLSETLNKPMDIVVSWFLLLIIFVFDPLAISLVIAASFAFEQAYPPKPPKPEISNTPSPPEDLPSPQPPPPIEPEPQPKETIEELIEPPINNKEEEEDVIEEWEKPNEDLIKAAEKYTQQKLTPKKTGPKLSPKRDDNGITYNMSS